MFDIFYWWSKQATSSIPELKKKSGSKDEPMKNKSYFHFWFGKKKEPIKTIMVGLDAAGKTTILYQLAGNTEVETTIPTIGFNVETLTRRDTNFTCWDIGGCDKIRPLWRHYFQDVGALLLVVDSHDRDRVNEIYDEVKFFLDESSVPLLVIANKQDLPGNLTNSEIASALRLNTLTGRRWAMLNTCATTRVGLDMIIPTLERLIEESSCTNDNLTSHRVSNRVNDYDANDTSGGLPYTPSTSPSTNLPPTPSLASSTSISAELPSTPVISSVDTAIQIRQQQLLQNTWDEWIQRPLHPSQDDVFMDQLERYELDLWDHYTHVRVGYLLLLRYGWETGSSQVCRSLENFILHSSLTNAGRSFNCTMTFFWCNLIYFWLQRYQQHQTSVNGNMEYERTDSESDFCNFLFYVSQNREVSTDLGDKGLFRQYYTSSVIFGEAARREYVAPDIKELPSV